MNEDSEGHECNLLEACNICCRPAIMPRPDNVRLSIKEKSVGPRDDPYSWTQRTITFLDTGRKVSLEIDSFAEAIRLSGDSVGTEEAERWAPDGGAAYKRLEEEFEQLSGMDVFSFDWHYYDKEGGELAEIRSAEISAGWDPNP